ncbi:MAG: hypothetical protein K8T91_11385 [Planctomycetes bacterium]|nr:hypothetical protein [Planctomycetota bacterium]
MIKVRCALALLLLACGCKRELSPGPDVSPAPPASVAQPSPESDDILDRQMTVDTLYFANDGRELVAPGNVLRATVDPTTRKLAWAAWQCDNPQCPGRKPDGKPQLFPWPNPFLFIKEDGTIATRQPVTEPELLQADENRDVRCPACLKNRNLSAETPQQREQYRNWCRLHVLPQAAQQRKKLEDEYRRVMGSR